MTSKERITAAMHNKVPDRVPVSLGLSEMVPVRFFGDDYIDFFWKNKTPTWKARVETERPPDSEFLKLLPPPVPAPSFTPAQEELGFALWWGDYSRIMDCLQPPLRRPASGCPMNIQFFFLCGALHKKLC